MDKDLKVLTSEVMRALIFKFSKDIEAEGIGFIRLESDISFSELTTSQSNELVRSISSPS